MSVYDGKTTKSGDGEFMEESIQGAYKVSYKINRHLVSDKSDFQRVDIIDNPLFGRMLFNDGLAMVSERDEAVYHEMMAHVPMFLHPEPKRVLVIGGGDGGTAREVVRHASVEAVDMVEIDQLVVESCRQYLPQTACGMNHPKVQVHIEDGLKFVNEAPDKSYDVIMVDSTDPIGPAQPLFGPAFYQDIFRVLTDDGVVVAQGESFYFNPEEQKSILNSMRAAGFLKTYMYQYSNLTYPGGLWGFACASKRWQPVRDIQFERLNNFSSDKEPMFYFNAGILRSCWELPEFVKRNLYGLIEHNITYQQG